MLTVPKPCPSAPRKCSECIGLPTFPTSLTRCSSGSLPYTCRLRCSHTALELGSAPGIRTLTEPGLSRTPLPIGIERHITQMKLPLGENTALGVAPIFLPYEPEQLLLQHGVAPFFVFFLCCFSDRSNGLSQFAQINEIILSTLANLTFLSKLVQVRGFEPPSQRF